MMRLVYKPYRPARALHRSLQVSTSALEGVLILIVFGAHVRGRQPSSRSCAMRTAECLREVREHPTPQREDDGADLVWS